MTMAAGLLDLLKVCRQGSLIAIRKGSNKISHDPGQDASGREYQAVTGGKQL
jgi:hypothetical protein